MNPTYSERIKLIGTPIIKETKKGCSVTQKYEIGGTKRIVSFDVNKKIDSNEALRICQEKLNELSQYIESGKNEKIERNSIKINSNKENFININSIKENVLDVESKEEIKKEELESKLNIDQNKNVYHLMLDKLFIEQSKDYEGSDMGSSASMLMHGLKLVDSGLKKGNNTREVQEMLIFCDRMKKNLLGYISICREINKDEKLLSRVVQDIHNLEIGDSYLVPCGLKQHTMAMLFKKTSEKKVEITLYNTGLGVSHHHCLNQQSSKFQTYDTIADVPIESIKETKLLSLVNITCKETDPSFLYDFFWNNLGKEGQNIPRSEHEEDYEPIQKTGTCGVQCLMAFIRHQAMLAKEGTYSEKLAFYKIFKRKLFLHYMNDTMNALDQTIQKHAGTAIRKVLAAGKTEKIADNIEKFNEAFTRITDLLQECGEIELVESLKQKKLSAGTALSRYALLRLASSKLSIAWLKNPSKFSFENFSKEEFLRLAVAKYAHYYATLKNYDIHLSRAENFDKSIHLIFSMLLREPLKEHAIQKIVRLCKEDPEAAEEIFIRFKENQEKWEPFAEEIIERLEKEKHSNAANFKEFWEKPL